MSVAPAPEPSSHLVFVQLGGGYELVETEGPPPPLHTLLELPQFSEDEFVVTRLGRSPLPSDAALLHLRPARLPRAGPVGRLRVPVVPAAGTALRRVVFADRCRRVVERDPDRDDVRVLPASTPSRSATCSTVWIA